MLTFDVLPGAILKMTNPLIANKYCINAEKLVEIVTEKDFLRNFT